MRAPRVLRVAVAALLATVGLAVVSPATAQGAAQAVMMENYAYSPSTLTIRVGDTVTWTNHDQAPHDVVTTSAPVPIHGSLLSQGQSWSYTFTTAGTYSYYCSVHPDMRAQIIVQPAPAAAPAPAPVGTAPKSTAPRTTKSSSPATQHSMPAMGAPESSAPAEEAPVSTEVAAPQPQQAVVAAAAPTTTSTLNPMLIVAGVAAGIAVLCLLLLGSRRQT